MQGSAQTRWDLYTHRSPMPASWIKEKGWGEKAGNGERRKGREESGKWRKGKGREGKGYPSHFRFSGYAHACHTTLSRLTFARHLKAHLFGWSAARLRTIYDALCKSTHHHHHHHTLLRTIESNFARRKWCHNNKRVSQTVCPTSWRKNNWQRYHMKKLRHSCHSVYTYCFFLRKFGYHQLWNVVTKSELSQFFCFLL